MKLNAYVLAGDPAWATESLRSYYHLVDRVIVSHDRGHRSWAGHPMAVEESLAALRKADPDDKIRVLPGHWSDPDRPILEVETEQREAARLAAAESADWVLQFDTDEVLLSPSTFLAQLREADRRGADALHYPLRNFYKRLSDDRFLEKCGPFWTTQASYPGPLAVRSTTHLTHCRQAAAATYRVDFRPWNTDPSHPSGARVHAVIRPDEGVAHLSWVRTPEQMAAKALISGYAPERNWDRDVREWEWRGRHPRLAALGSALSRDRWNRVRIARLEV